MTPEQDKNLKEILGFDPNESEQNPHSPEGNSSDITPLQMAAKTLGISVEEAHREFEKYCKGLYVDAKNLFSIFVYGDNNNCRRGYWCVAGTEEKFRLSAGCGLYSDDEKMGYFNMKATSEYYDESEGSEGLIFRWDGSLDVDCNRDDIDESIRITYDRNRNTIVYIFINYFSKETDTGIALGYDFIRKKYEAHRISDFDTPPFSFEERDGIMHISVFKDGEEDEHFEIPTHVKIDELFHEMYPQDLIKNPQSPDINLDNAWREKTPFERLGIKWEVLGERKVNSREKKYGVKR